jgi:hypothetical protein
MAGGAPSGNKNAVKGRKAEAALNKALAIRDGVEPTETTETFQCLIDMWDKQIEEALEGDKGSMQMIVERLDGKPKQAIVGGDEDDAPVLHEIRRTIVRA